MSRLLLALLLPAIAHADSHEQIPIDEAYIMVCGSADGIYFVRPTGIVYGMQGMSGAPNCMAVIDTEGNGHTLCKAKDSPEICELAEPGPEV